MREKIERQLPTGIGGEKLKEGRETLPAVEVKNEVSWVNNKMNLPFDLKVGKQSPLGVFLTPHLKEGKRVYNLEVSGVHTRSGILGRVIFSDEEGRLYRDIDIKGAGYIRKNRNNKVEVGPIKGSYGKISGERSDFSSFDGTTGIANQEFIRRDISFSEKFLKAGIRTHRVVAVLDLKEIIDDDGYKISIDEAKKKRFLSKEDEPVIEVRAYGVKTRIFDVVQALRNLDKEKALNLLSDAKSVVAQELDLDPNTFSFGDYFQWLIKITAINIARMHYNKWVSGYLTHHNFTLDGRIVDLDSVETEQEAANRDMDKEDRFAEPKTFKNDLFETEGTLMNLLGRVKIIEIYSFDESRRNFFTYFEELYEEELKRLKTEKVRRIR